MPRIPQTLSELLAAGAAPSPSRQGQSDDEIFGTFSTIWDGNRKGEIIFFLHLKAPRWRARQKCPACCIQLWAAVQWSSVAPILKLWSLGKNEPVIVSPLKANDSVTRWHEEGCQQHGESFPPPSGNTAQDVTTVSWQCGSSNISLEWCIWMSVGRFPAVPGNHEFLRAMLGALSGAVCRHQSSQLSSEARGDPRRPPPHPLYYLICSVNFPLSLSLAILKLFLSRLGLDWD